jgi:hypothetical protein
METLKDKTKALRQKVRDLMAEYNHLHNEILSSMNSTPEMGINDPTDKLRFYLADEVCQGFSHTATNLYRIWDTYPKTELVRDSAIDHLTNYQGDSDGTVGVD